MANNKCKNCLPTPGRFIRTTDDMKHCADCGKNLASNSMKDSIKYDINTIINYKDKRIIQDIRSPNIDNIIQTIHRTILDTKEEQLRDALIKLGWTPPKDI